MIIEVRNVTLRNKGAELMLRSILDRYADRDDVTFTASHRVGSSKKRRELGMAPLLYIKTDRGFITIPRFLLPGPIRRALGIVHPAEIDLVLDASGFAYGDQWGPNKALSSARYYRYLKRFGAKIAMLPQSLGPFKDAKVRQAAALLLEFVDLVFPRDDTAASEVHDLIGDDPRVHQRPDFTPLLSGEDGVALPAGDKPAAIIPNRKMIQKGGMTQSDYERFLVEVVEFFRALGYTPFMLPHATFDHELVEAVKAQTAVESLIEPDPLRLKSIIGRCHTVFSSRFHGLVSSLSQGVPVIATGWSHKYAHLLTEYDCIEALVDPHTAGSLEAAIKSVLRGENYAASKARIEERARWNKEQAEAMWQQVDALLG